MIFQGLKERFMFGKMSMDFYYIYIRVSRTLIILFVNCYEINLILQSIQGLILKLKLKWVTVLTTNSD